MSKSPGLSSGVVHSIRCADQCAGPEAIAEKRVVADKGEVFERTPEGELTQLMCENCGTAAMSVVYQPFSIGGRRAGSTKLNDGTVVTSPDSTVCAAGRQLVGPGGFDDANLRPGQSRTLNIAGVGIEATRSSMGGEVQLRRTDI